MSGLFTKQNILRATRLFASHIGIAVLSIIVYVFITMFAVSAFSNEVGYQVYRKVNDKDYVLEYTHHFEDGEDDRLASYKEDEIYKQPLRVLPDKANVAVKIVVQILTLLIFGYLIYGYAWNKGHEDSTQKELNDLDTNKHFGFKLGLLGAAPFFVIYLLMFAEKFMKTSFALSVYRLTNFSAFYLAELSCNGATKAVDLAAWSYLPLLAILFILPVFSWFGYYMGYKNVNIRTNLVYGKKGRDR